MTPQPPPSGYGSVSSTQAAGQRQVTSGIRDHAGELAHHRELLIAVQSTRVGQHLHANVAGLAVDVRQVVLTAKAEAQERAVAAVRNHTNM